MKLEKTLRSIGSILCLPLYFGSFLGLWFVTVTIFIWLININLLAYVLVSSGLTAAGKITFIFDAFANFFRYLDNPTGLTSLVFSLLIALNFTLIVYLWRAGKRKQQLGGTNAGVFAAMIGAHCVSCGTSLLAPFITAIAGSGAYLSADRARAGVLLTTGANLLGIGLVIWSISKVTNNIIRNGLNPT